MSYSEFVLSSNLSTLSLSLLLLQYAIGPIRISTSRAQQYPQDRCRTTTVSHVTKAANNRI